MPRRTMIAVGALAAVVALARFRCGADGSTARIEADSVVRTHAIAHAPPSAQPIPTTRSSELIDSMVLVRPGIPVDSLAPSPATDTGDASELVRHGWNLVRSGDYAAARVELDRAVAADADNPEALYWLAVATASQGAKLSALFDAQHAVAVDPGFAAARTLVSGLETDLGRTDDAIHGLSQVLEGNPSYGGGLASALRAVARLKKGDVASAMLDAKSACGLGNKDGCRIGRLFGGGAAGERYQLLGWLELP